MSGGGGIQLKGAGTLFYKEVLRFWKVSFQTVAAPVLTAVLYLLVFGHVLEDHVKVYGTVGYTAFLIPGLGDDERLAELVCQLVLQPDPKQGDRQPGLPAGDPAVALGLVRPPMWAPPWCAAWSWVWACCW